MTEPYQFKEGDKVKWCGAKGVVRCVDLERMYPVKVSFPSGQPASFTLDGRYISWHTKPSLKLRKFKKKDVKKSTQPPTFKVGDKVKFRGVNGVVRRVTPGVPYPIMVYLRGHMVGFTFDGREWASDSLSSLKLRKFEKKEVATQNNIVSFVRELDGTK